LDDKRYQSFYKFEEADAEWVTLKKYGSWCKAFPQIIAIDCEMCETKDPLTGNKDGE
jgi:hypothetical protein